MKESVLKRSFYCQRSSPLLINHIHVNLYKFTTNYFLTVEFLLEFKLEVETLFRRVAECIGEEETSVQDRRRALSIRASMSLPII